MEPLCGGFGNVQQANDDIRSLTIQVKPEVESKLGKTYNSFESVSFTSQIVAGTCYKVKVKVGDNEYIHVKFAKTLPCYGGQIKFIEAQDGKTLADAL